MQKHLIEFHIHMDKPSCVKKNTGRSRVWCQRAVTPVVWETEGGLSQSGVLRGGRLGSRTECTAWWCTVSKRKTKAENLSSLCRTLDSSPSPRTGRVDGDFNLRRCIQKKTHKANIIYNGKRRKAFSLQEEMGKSIYCSPRKHSSSSQCNAIRKRVLMQSMLTTLLPPPPPSISHFLPDPPHFPTHTQLHALSFFLSLENKQNTRGKKQFDF